MPPPPGRGTDTRRTAAPGLETARSRLRLRYLNLALWTLQGWLVMFFVAAGYAKLTQPFDLLTLLLQWPSMTGHAFTRRVGVAEIGMAAALLVPLFSWRLGRPFLLCGAAVLLAEEIVMLAMHTAGGETGLALVNAVLILITMPILWFRFTLPGRHAV